MKPPTVAPAYVMLFAPLSEIAREHGYALAVHGSVQSDFDLIAVPWVNDAKPAEQLVRAIAERLDLLRDAFGTGISDEPEAKPHGRLAWNLFISGSARLDLSVMPQQRTEIGLEAAISRIKTEVWALRDQFAVPSRAQYNLDAARESLRSALTSVEFEKQNINADQ